MVTATTLNTSPARTPEQEIHNEDRTVLDTDSTGRNQNTTDNVLYADDFEYTEEPEMEQYNAKTGKTTRQQEAMSHVTCWIRMALTL